MGWGGVDNREVRKHEPSFCMNINVCLGAMDEIIIVGVDNTDDRINELTYSYDASVGT